jgi:transposase-like protein
MLKKHKNITIHITIHSKKQKNYKDPKHGTNEKKRKIKKKSWKILIDECVWKKKSFVIL